MKNRSSTYSDKLELKDSCFDGYEYKGYTIHTKMVVRGRDEYKPMKVSKTSDVYDTFKKLRESDRERFYSIHLNSDNNVIGVEMVSQGSLASVPVHPREVYKSAILSSAKGLILVHAHPSGNPLPSKEDREITKRLIEAGKLLGIEVLDHIIIGDDAYYSFSEDGGWD